MCVVRENLRELSKEYDRSEDDLKALQSGVGQIVGEVLRQLTEDKCKSTSPLTVEVMYPCGWIVLCSACHLILLTYGNGRQSRPVWYRSSIFPLLPLLSLTHTHSYCEGI